MSSEQQLAWVTEYELRELGFAPTGPEHDLGQRLGDQATIRVSFAPCGSSDFGYVYAYDAAVDRYAVLAAGATLETVLLAYSHVTADRPTPQGYLALADTLNNQPDLTLAHPRELWLHCVRAEAHARRDYDYLPADASNRFDAARRVVLARAARTAAEDILLHSLQAEPGAGNEPVVITYRVTDSGEWTGQVAAPDISEAAFRIVDLARTIAASGYHVHAEQVVHDGNRIPAARLPELAAFTRGISPDLSRRIEF